MLADIGTLPHDIKERVEQWVKKGGILVRFAGPRLEKGGDDLLPVPLRLGGRTLGGALSWATPQPLAPFGDDSLFAGLTPPAEVLVNKQVLADPAGLGPEVKVWARLKDGTPLVTAAKRGDGQLIFFHVTANSDWSNLPLSGLFVEMLRRIASLGGTGGAGEALVGDGKGADVGRAGRRRGAGAPAGARRLRAAQEPAADDAGHRRGQDRRRAPQRREPARLLRPCRRAARAQPDDAQEPAQAAAVDADGRRAPRLRGRHRPADQAAAAHDRAGAAVRRHRRRAAAAGRAACCSAAAPHAPARPRWPPSPSPRPRCSRLPARPTPRPRPEPAHRPRGPAPTTRAPSRRPPRSPSATCCRATGPPTRRAGRASWGSAGSSSSARPSSRESRSPSTSSTTRSPSSRCSTGRCWPTRGRCRRRRSPRSTPT